MTLSIVPPLDPDPSLRGVRELLCPEGAEVVASFLRKRRFECQAVRPVQAGYRPESSFIVRFRVRALDPDGRERHLTICAETRAEPKEYRAAPDTFAERHRFPDPVERDGPYLLWVFPYDPGLKELPDAAWGPWAKTELKRSGQTFRAVNVQPTMYRPRRRAMFRYFGITSLDDDVPPVTYAKVLRGTRLARSLEVSHALAPRRRFADRLFGRRPPLRLLLPIGQAGSNTLLFKPAPGTSLRDLLLNDGSLPHPSRVVKVMQDVAGIAPHTQLGPSARHKRPPAEIAHTTGVLIERLLPEAAGTVARVTEAIERGSEHPGVPPCLVHGDLYDGQIFIDADFSLSLIDLDDVGLGDPAQDVANFCAHLLVMAMSHPQAKDRLTAYRTLLRQEFMGTFDVSPEMLGWREALVVMQLAVGPFRTLSAEWPAQVLRRLQLAARLC